MAWRVAKSLDTLLGQINAAAPNRSKTYDGSIGDAAHAARASDHNPDPRGIVHARDYMHDPAHGCDIGIIFSAISKSNDTRVKYLIWNRQTTRWQSGKLIWVPYYGPNPHITHGHLSVNTIGEDDPRQWTIGNQEDGMGITSRSSPRNGTKVIWIGLHTTEGGGTARELRDADWWTGSSHAISDNRELLTPAEGCVPYARASWTLRAGNVKSVNIEQVGLAKWSREHWLSTQMPMLRHTARWVADMSKMFGIPLEYIGTAGVKAGRAGVIEHNDYSKGTGDGSHWDCGPGYPVDVVIDMARGAGSGEDDEMTPQDREWFLDWRKRSETSFNDIWKVLGVRKDGDRIGDLWKVLGVRPDGQDRLSDLWKQEQATQAEVAKLTAEVKALREKH